MVDDRKRADEERRQEEPFQVSAASRRSSPPASARKRRAAALLPGEMEEQRIGERIGERPDADVELLHRPIITDPCHVYPVFRPLELVLKVEKRLVCLEVRILLGNDEKSRQGRAELRLGLLVARNRVGPVEHLFRDLHAPHLCPRLRDRRQRLVFVPRVAFDHLDEIGHEVRPPLVRCLNIPPCRKNSLFFCLHLIIAATAKTGQHDCQGRKEEKFSHGPSGHAIFAIITDIAALCHRSRPRRPCAAGLTRAAGLLFSVTFCHFLSPIVGLQARFCAIVTSMEVLRRPPAPSAQGRRVCNKNGNRDEKCIIFLF